MEARTIRIVGARQHNLRNLSLEIPRDRLVVLTGLSGSGKSSLAFDTIYAEGQRKYVESLSVHARHFLEQLEKPDVDQIEGLPPTLAIEQRATAVNPRSTVATTTEIYDFLRVLFARVGKPHCPKCGKEIFRRTVDQIVDAVMAYPPASRVMLLAPLLRGRSGDAEQALRRIAREGFVRARVNGELIDVKDVGEIGKGRKLDVDIVIDRIVLREDVRSRVADAIELSLALGEGTLIASRHRGAAAAVTSPTNGKSEWSDEVFSERHTCTTCGVGLPELSPRMFSFNSPYGACAPCGGLGRVPRFDPQYIVPDENQPVIGGALTPWAGPKGRLSGPALKAVKALCAAFNINPETPFRNLPEELRRMLLFGTKPADTRAHEIEFEGVIPNLERRIASAGGDVRSSLSVYQCDDLCNACGGARLQPAALAVRVADRNIHDCAQLTIGAAAAFFDSVRFEGEAEAIAAPILREVRQRLRFLNEVGLDYLALDRTSATLSGGEAQRIRLATQLGSGLVGVCYVLDEPTIGLHQRDNQRLLAAIRRLVEIGNSVLVVEHDEDVIRAADYLIDMGPGAGLHGGKIIAAGTAAAVLANPQSITGRYLSGEYSLELPEQRRPIRSDRMLQIMGAAENNLKGIDSRIPLGVFVAITGVSGSGKSTLISQILLPALRRRLYFSRERPGAHERLLGAEFIDKVIEIDQTPIGRSPRSNPATYTGVFDEIRRLYAKTKEARVRGFDASRFSFNAKGGRCEACQGQGVRRIEMHFLPDVFVVCQECKGTRYNRETLEIRYRAKSIADVLAMRIEDCLKFFDSFPKIKQGIQALSDVGLGYIELGQPSNTLSGGEAQRVKLAGELARGAATAGPVALDNGGTGRGRGAGGRGDNHTLYVLDEPTTGLHFADIQTLLAVLNRLVDRGNTVLVIEHNLDVIKTADWILDLGPEGGAGGGRIVAEGTPEQIATCADSLTGQHLRGKLAHAAR